MMEGVQMTLRLTAGGLSMAQRFVLMVKKTLDAEKKMGKTSMKKLLERGGDVQVFEFPTCRLSEVEKLCKKYGILYSVLPDINENDGMTEILFHTSSMGRFRTIMEHLGVGRLVSMEDYLENEELEEERKTRQTEERRCQVRGHPDRVEELMEHLQCLHKYEDETKTAITVDRSILIDRTEAVMTLQIPGHPKERFQVGMQDVYELKKNKTYLVFLDKEKEYPIFDKEQMVKQQKKGAEIGQSFDDVHGYFGRSARRRKRTQNGRNRGRNL